MNLSIIWTVIGFLPLVTAIVMIIRRRREVGPDEEEPETSDGFYPDADEPPRVDPKTGTPFT